MPKTPTPAAGEAMPAAKINRRKMLTGTVAAITGTTAALATGQALATVTPTNEAERELAAFLAELDRGIADRDAAVEAKDWKLAEYEHLWPLAPEEILGLTGAWEIARDRAYEADNGHLLPETNLVGEPIYRRVGDLNLRAMRFFGRNAKKDVDGRVSFSVETPDDLRRSIATVSAWRVRAESGRRERDRRIAESEALIPISKRYFAKVKRLRKVSGIYDILAAREAAERRMQATVDAMFAVSATTPLGAAMKAQGLRQWSTAMGYNERTISDLIEAPYAQGIVGDILAMSLIEGEAHNG